MQKSLSWLFVFLLSITAARAQGNSGAVDSSPHKIQFISVDRGITLEVLDWGGTGRPLVFLAGGGLTGHQFDNFAPKFTTNHHVYAITRRGYGASSAPDPVNSDYSADRLGADVVAVIDTLKLDRPVLAGHSLAGEELTAVATRHPEKVSGLIYLDAGYAYAYYVPGSLNPLGASIIIDLHELQQDRAIFIAAPSRNDIQNFQAHLTDLEKDIPATRPFLDTMATASGPKQPETPRSKINSALIDGMEKYTAIPLPALALFATDLKAPDNATADQRAANLASNARRAKQINMFEQGVPSARVVRLAGGDHAIYESNEADVFQEMNKFMDGLK
jgi:non-heme chloroperoxidase